MNTVPPPQIDWSVPPSREEIEQLREVARLPLWVKLEWLEQMQKIAEHMQKQHAQRRAERAAVQCERQELNHE